MARILVVERPRRSTARISLWVGAIALLTLSVFLMISGTSNNTPSPKQEVRDRSQYVVAHMHDIFSQNDAMKKAPADIWWFKEVPPPSGEWYKVFELKRIEIEKILAANAHVSPEAAKIAQRFKELHTVMYIDGKMKDISIKGKERPFSPDMMVVCFLPKDQADLGKNYIPQFNQDYMAVVVPGIQFPPALYAAALVHEFGHALRHNGFDGKPDNSVGTYANAEEEVLMHELGGAVLNDYSSGVYNKLADEVIKRAPKGKGFEAAIMAITAADYHRIDEQFGCTETEIPSNLLTTHFAMYVAFRYCDSEGLGMNSKVAVYQWFEKNVLSMPGK